MSTLPIEMAFNTRASTLLKKDVVRLLAEKYGFDEEEAMALVLDTQRVQYANEMVPDLAFRTWIQEFLTYLSNTSSCLEQRHPEITKRLNALCGDGQGLGNKASFHEACFAYELEARGCMNLTFPASDGYFYIYQANGTQKSIDFQVVSVKAGQVVDKFDFDLKHGSGKSIYLNDGTFLDDVIYVISFTRIVPVKGQRKGDRRNICAIARGQDIFTELEKIELDKWFEDIKQKNSNKNVVGSLRMYARSANQYDCDKRFDDAFTLDRFQKTLAWISQSVPHTEEAPHSQSA